MGDTQTTRVQTAVKTKPIAFRTLVVAVLPIAVSRDPFCFILGDLRVVSLCPQVLSPG